MSKILKFWVDCEYDRRQDENADRTKFQLLAEILREFEEAGHAMRYLNSKSQIAWRATPRMLTRLADAERQPTRENHSATQFVPAASPACRFNCDRPSPVSNLIDHTGRSTRSSFRLDARIAPGVPGGGITGVLPPPLGGTEMPGSRPAGGQIRPLDWES
jgi:hypothetical protein